MSKISFIKSSDRRYNIERCLSLLKSEIISGIRNAENIVVRPNCIYENDKLLSTKAETLEAVLSFIRPYTKKQITLAEGTVYGDTLKAFKNNHYLSLQEEYDLALTDLNEDEFEIINILDKNDNEIKLKFSKTILNSDYLISIATPSTDELTVYSGVIKSTVIGSINKTDNSVASKLSSKIGISKNSKFLVNQGYMNTNQNVKNLFYKTPISLAVLDGFEVITGEGTSDGQMIPGHFAVASSDPFAADWLTSQLLNINIDHIGYMKMLESEEENKTDYFIIGDNWQKHTIKTKMHNNFLKAKNWHLK